MNMNDGRRIAIEDSLKELYRKVYDFDKIDTLFEFQHIDVVSGVGYIVRVNIEVEPMNREEARKAMDEYDNRDPMFTKFRDGFY